MPGWWAMIELPVTFFSLTTGAPFQRSSQALWCDTQTPFRPCLHSNVIKLRGDFPPQLGRKRIRSKRQASWRSCLVKQSHRGRKEASLSLALGTSWGALQPLSHFQRSQWQLASHGDQLTDKTSHSAWPLPNARVQSVPSSTVWLQFCEVWVKTYK